MQRNKDPTALRTTTTPGPLVPNLWVEANHDLRQPLHALFFMTRSLARSGNDPKLKEIAKYMQAALQGLQTKIDLLTLLSRIECSSTIPLLRPCTLGQIWEDLLGLLSVVAEGQGVRLRSCVHDVCVTSDPVLLSLIVKSLVLNAVKLTTDRDVLIGSRRRALGVSLELYFRGSDVGEMQAKGAFVNVSSRDEAGSSELGLGLGFIGHLAKRLGHHLDCLMRAPGTVCLALSIGPPTTAATWSQ
jgi:signal transduction histidine kinase